MVELKKGKWSKSNGDLWATFTGKYGPLSPFPNVPLDVFIGCGMIMQEKSCQPIGNKESN
jgi:hypothetical protein